MPTTVDEEKNFRTLAKFIKSSCLKTDEYGNIRFKAWVVYNTAKSRTAESVFVKLIRNGYNDGNIEIEAGEELTNETHHLGHSARLQFYSIRRNSNALVIRGKSRRETYEIEIRAV